MNAQDLMAGYSTYTSAEELAMDADQGALAISPTTTVTTSSAPCTAISVVSIDNTFDHWC